MAHPAGETKDGVLRLDFNRRLMLQFCGSVVTSDAGLLPYRELDDVPGLTVIAGNSLADAHGQERPPCACRFAASVRFQSFSVASPDTRT